jgi:hypothetical protein
MLERFKKEAARRNANERVSWRLTYATRRLWLTSCRVEQNLREITHETARLGIVAHTSDGDVRKERTCGYHLRQLTRISGIRCAGGLGVFQELESAPSTSGSNCLRTEPTICNVFIVASRYLDLSATSIAIFKQASTTTSAMWRRRFLLGLHRSDLF